MKNSELIKLLKQFNGDIEVTTSNRNGVFNDITGVEMQLWEKGEDKHASITLILGGYNSNKSKLSNKNENKLFEIELNDNNDDEEFIDNVNKNLDNCDKIDKEEALKAKEDFKSDIKNMQKKYKEWFNKKYDKIAHDAMIELFGDDKPLNNKTIQDLKLHIYENGWQGEVDKEELNNRSAILRVLYEKLDNRVKEKLSKDTNKLWNDVTGCDCSKGKKVCKHKEKKHTKPMNLFDLLENIDDEMFNDDWFSDFEGNINQFRTFNHLFI